MSIFEHVGLRRLAAFTTDPSGGNPAGVWIGNEMPENAAMQEIARNVGYSETAFVTPHDGTERHIRYFSPGGEVTFCGHATIAAGSVLGEETGPGRYRLQTLAGVVELDVRPANGLFEVSLTSVEPSHQLASDEILDEALAALDWTRSDLDPTIEPAIAYAGAYHLIIAVNSRERLSRLDYDFDRLRSLMTRKDLTTLQLIWRETPNLFHARDPFPVGGVTEDPATGAAAAALGGYLRDRKLTEAPTQIMIHQGDDMGRPSLIKVDIPLTGGIVVTGTAVDLEPNHQEP